MTRDTGNKPIRDKDPGNTGVYGIVRVGTCLDEWVKGVFRVLIQRRDGEWVEDEGLAELVTGRGVLVVDGYEKRGGEVWWVQSYALPRDLLHGREDYVQEWVPANTLPRRLISFEAGVRVTRRVLPDGTIEEEIKGEDEEEKKER